MMDSADNNLNDVPEITPLNEYNPENSRLRASISWILQKAYGSNIPTDLDTPLIEVQGSTQLSEGAQNKLASGEVYCKACSKLFKSSNAQQWQAGYWSVFQALSKRGIYVEDGDTPVTETTLIERLPFNLSGHLALIEALMTAYVTDIISIERVVQCVRKFSTVNASSELPYDSEDALLFWVNKCCSTVQHKLDKVQQSKQQHLIQQQTTQKVRVQKKLLTPRELPSIPTMEDLLKDISDGCCLAALLHFYCPSSIDLNDICLKSVIGIADSIYNLQLVKTFCQRHLTSVGSTLRFEDFLYSPSVMKPCVLALLCDIFDSLEIHKASCVEDVTKYMETNPSSEASKGKPPIQFPAISEATKRSFQQSPVTEGGDLRSALSGSNPDLSPSASRQPLLPKRFQQHRSSLHGTETTESQSGRSASLDASGIARGSVTAWEETKGSKESGGAESLLTNVSLDSELDQSFTTDQSIDLSDLETPRSTTKDSQHSTPGSHLTDPAHPDYIKLESVTSNRSDSTSQPPREPLFPAKLKPAKEKQQLHNKEVESGEKQPKRSPSSPVKPYNPLPKPTNGSSSEGSTPDEAYSTPSVEYVPMNFPQTRPTATKPVEPARNFEAFYVDPSASLQRSLPDSSSTMSGVATPIAKSFTVDDSINDRVSAQARGIPVVESVNESSNFTPQAESGSSLTTHMRQHSKESTGSGNRSSGEYSDPELQKIHRDTRDREVRADSVETNRPHSLNVPKPIQVNSSQSSDAPSTSFAQMKKNRDNTQTAGISHPAFRQSGKENNRTIETNAKVSDNNDNDKAKPEGTQNSVGKSTTGGKRTTFAALPNQTTWQESATKSTTDKNTTSENGDTIQPLASELLSIKMMLEEKRRQIESEKHKMEAQWSKQRQRLGKTAFLQVVSKGSANTKPAQAGNIQVGQVQEQRDSNRSTPPPTQPTTSKPFSRQDIQQTIDHVKQKWFNEDESKLKTVPQSKPQQPSQSHSSPPVSRKITPPQSRDVQNVSGQTQRQSPPPRQGSPTQRQASPTQRQASPIQRQGSPSQRQSPKSVKQGDSDLEQYSSSLDNLNTSLSELQGEIMRLSLQQEQIKSLASETAPKKKTVPALGVTTAKEESFFMHPTQTSTPPVQSSFKQTYTVSSSQPQMAESAPPRSQPQYEPPSQQPVDQSQGRIQQVYEPQPHPQFIPPSTGYTQQQQPVYMQGQPGMGYNQPNHYPHPQAQVHQYAPGVTPPRPGYMLEQQQYIANHGQYPPNQGAYMGQYQPPMYQQTVPPQHMNQYPQGGYMQQPQGVMSSHPQGIMSSQPQVSAGMQYPTQPHLSQTYTTSSQPPLSPGVQQNGMEFKPDPSLSQTYNTQPSPGQVPMSQASPTPTPVDPPTEYQPPDYTDRNKRYSKAENQMMNEQSRLNGVSSPSTTYLPSPTVAPQASYTSPPASPRSPQTHISPIMQTPPTSPRDQIGHISPRDQTGHTSPRDQLGPISPRAQIGPDPIAEYLSPRKESEPEIEDFTEPPNPNDEPAGFFINFANDSPRRPKPKPKLGNNRSAKKEKDNNTPIKSNGPSATISSPVINNEDINVTPEKNILRTQNENVLQTPQSGNESINKPADISISPVGFTLGTEVLSPTSEDSIARRKEQMILNQLKRREQQVEKRAEREAKLEKKREQERLKQEAAEQKKLEDKMRRDQIFAEYQKKKEEREIAEEESKMGVRKAKPKPKSAKGVKSVKQEDVMSTSSHSQSSLEDGYGGRGTSPGKTTGSGDVMSYKISDVPDGGSRNGLQYGGLTHRRAASPDRLMGREGSDHGSYNSNQEYSGPKLFKKPSMKSNRHIIMNAISYCCLAGTVNNDVKNKVLDELEHSEANHFVILFRDAGMQYRAVYTYNPEPELVIKLIGNGPKQITGEMLEKFYKYNSGAKRFTEVLSTRHLSVSMDAVTIHGHLWQSKKPTSARKPPGGTYR
ncbi:unnamed protein product [Owenia fusiformis]|uniref:Uncharacterized protein n=1 Tax=Owenia fusiformis TaxID=6347 RepID=A0A8J1TQZ4_OWEFU|nr:unnamed protein product [Owenia fusiformis]